MKIDPEFKQLIPPLTTEEFNQLEENITKEGCRDALITWNGILLDGHNRFNICTREGIGYSTVEIDLPDRDAAIEWIIKNQFGRRNLTLYERGKLALRLEPIIRAKAKENQGKRTDLLQNSAKSIDTRKEVAKAAGVSSDTIDRIKVIEKFATTEQKADLIAQKKTVHKVFREIRPNAQPEVIPGVDEALTKECNICGIRKPITDFYFKRDQPNPQCKQCELFVRTSDNPTETREKLKGLNKHVVNGIDTILESMKTKKPAEAGKLKKIHNQSIADLTDLLKLFNIKLNQYLYMKPVLANEELPIELLESTIANLVMIKNFKEDK